jgi:hypothetical protein
VALAWLLRRPVCLADPRFTTPDLRREHGAALRAELVAVFATHMPCGMVRSVFETAFLVQIGDRGVRLPLNIAGRPIGTSSGGQRGFLFSRDVSTVARTGRRSLRSSASRRPSGTGYW